VLAARAIGAGVAVTIACAGTPAQVCDGDVVLLARAHKHTSPVPVGSRHFTLHAGQSSKLTVALNQTGRPLLRRLGKLPVQLLVTLNTPAGKVTLTSRQLTIKRARKHHTR
jgi:hypothetical protein